MSRVGAVLYAAEPLAYLSHRHPTSCAGQLAPLKQKLFAFDGVRTAAGEKADLRFDLDIDHLAVANEAGHQVVSQGSYEVFFKGAGQLLRVPVEVSGDDRVVAEFGF